MPGLQRVRKLPSFELHRRRRRTVGITVRDDGTVEVHAPQRASLRQIEEVVARHGAWIVQKSREHRERWRRLRARRFEDGDDIPYMGGTLRLRVHEVLGCAVGGPVRNGDTLAVEVPAGLAPAARRAVARYAVGRWLLEEAQEVFHSRHLWAARRVGDAAHEVIIKDMRSRWGSCGPRRRMSLNWRLILAPREVLDYVLVHELTHIRIQDHSARFWRRVERALPDWRRHRDWLAEFGSDLEL